MTYSPPRPLPRSRSRWGAPTQSRLGVDWRALAWIMTAILLVAGLVLIRLMRRQGETS